MSPTASGPVLPPGARCATHPDRDAHRACARCGAFVCPSCTVGDELCVACKKRLLADGVPWTPKEKARASARHLRSLVERGLRIELAIAAAGALASIGVGGGYLPAGIRALGTGSWFVACCLGLAVGGAAVAGFRQSEAGRPGPAVEGVFPASQAGLTGALALLPVALSVGALLVG